MKNITMFCIIALLLSLLINCASSVPNENNTRQSSSSTQPQQAIALYEGDAGRGMRLAIVPPEADNANIPVWLPVFVQGVLTRDFNKFTSITVVDRQFIETIQAEQQLSLSGNYSDENYIRIGNLTNAQYVLAGKLLRMSGGIYSLQLAVTDTETGERRASFTGTCTEALIMETAILKEAAVDLFSQLGITLTDAGTKEFFAVETALVSAETALSQGIVAENNGSVIEALSRYYEAGSYKVDLPEASTRLSGLSSDIKDSIGQDARNAIAQRKVWLDIIAECEEFYRCHLPYEVVYNPEMVQESINYNRETVDLKMAILLKPLDESTKVIRDIMTGLDKTGKKGEWNLWFWPARLNFFGAGGALVGNGTYFVNAENIFDFHWNATKHNFIKPDIMNEYRNINFIDSPVSPPFFGKKVELTALLLDENGNIIGRTKQTLRYAMGYCVSGGQRSQSRPSIWDFRLAPMAIPEWLYFKGVPVNALTDKTYIRIHSLDGVELETSGNDYVRISMGKIF